MVRGQSLGHSVFATPFLTRLPLPAKAKEVESMETARIAKNIFFILYFLNLKYCLLNKMLNIFGWVPAIR